MGTEPEEIENALRGKRTLPEPGKEVTWQAGGKQPAKRKGVADTRRKFPGAP